MTRIGLALSGGGFRATLYHLGVVRYLRSAGLLDSISHITSVSGGSVLGAHLVLNWDRYTGDTKDFNEAAQEILDFTRLDVRNRIVRRYPFVMAGGLGRRIMRLNRGRRLTRTWLLEAHYARFLYGDTCLHQLPKSPELHILSTNLSVGGISSFNRSGLLMEQRSLAGGLNLVHHHVGLATVPMAVAASSAFPGFFPPLELTPETVGALEGEFQTQFFTDGGVYDNLGVRMFRYLERQQQEVLKETDFEDLEGAMAVWNRAAESPEHAPINRLVKIYTSVASTDQQYGNRTGVLAEPDQFCKGLARLISQGELQRDEHLRCLLETGGNENGNSDGNSDGPSAETGDHLVQNRRIVQAVFEQAAGKSVLGPPHHGFDAIIASDAGKKFEVSRPERIGGFLRTALRSSDILMDRVWQLEKEHFSNAKGFVFAPITRVISEEEDPTALHPEVQIQVSHIRTDMDRFCDREVSGLVRHGYCVVRQALATLPSVFGNYQVDNPPWDPTTHATTLASHSTHNEGRRGSKATLATVEARKLQQSARRKYRSMVAAPRDWVTYLYIPVLLFVVGFLPWLGWRTYRHAHVNAMLTQAIAQSRDDYGKILELLEYGSVEPWKPMEFVEASEPSDLFEAQGLDIISDTRITDLRKWFAPSGAGEAPEDRQVYICRHVSVRKIAESKVETALRMQTLWDLPQIMIRCQNGELHPKLRRCNQSKTGEDGPYLWELKLDFSKVAIGQTVDVVVEAIVDAESAGPDADKKEWWRFGVDSDPEVASAWILLPAGQQYANFNLIRYKVDAPETVTIVQPTRKSVIHNGSILNWSVVHPEPGYTYSCRWALEL